MQGWTDGGCPQRGAVEAPRESTWQYHARGDQRVSLSTLCRLCKSVIIAAFRCEVIEGLVMRSHRLLSEQTRGRVVQIEC